MHTHTLTTDVSCEYRCYLFITVKVCTLRDLNAASKVLTTVAYQGLLNNIVNIIIIITLDKRVYCCQCSCVHGHDRLPNLLDNGLRQLSKCPIVYS